MGRNAQARRAEKLNAKLAAPATVRPFETRTQHDLRKRLAEVTTLAQFEQMLSGTADVEHRGRLRDLLTPMLPPGLPCCGPAKLAAAVLRPIAPHEHNVFCPTRAILLVMK